MEMIANCLKHVGTGLAVFCWLGVCAATPGDAASMSANLGYEASRWHPLHFPPAVDQATNEDCLACHKEIVETQVREVASAGVRATDSLAWYQTLDTYDGPQMTFHQRHLTSAHAKKVMNLKCTFCHLGNDPREEAVLPPTDGEDRFTLRKMVNPKTTCLRCHAASPYEFMEGVDGPWNEVREDFEDEETKNGCLTCHEELFRTVRHRVNYLNADAIEDAAKDSSDVCFGCHGGRAWYRITYPLPRHPWPEMPEETPEWAKDRPTQSEARDLVGVEK